MREEGQQEDKQSRSEDSGQERNSSQTRSDRTHHVTAYPGTDDADDGRRQEAAGDRTGDHSLGDVSTSGCDEEKKNKAENSHEDLQIGLSW